MSSDKQMVQKEIKKRIQEKRELDGDIAHLRRILQEAPAISRRAEDALYNPDGQNDYLEATKEYGALFKVKDPFKIFDIPSPGLPEHFDRG